MSSTRAVLVALLFVGVIASGCVSAGVDEGVSRSSTNAAPGPLPVSGIGPASSEPGVSRLTPVPDPTAPGPLSWTELAYDLGPEVVASGPQRHPVPVLMRGEVYVPEGAEPLPLVVLMHGNHWTCEVAMFPLVGASPCPRTPVTEPSDSYLGYGYLAENLASHGFVVVSIDANRANDASFTGHHIETRARILLRTMEHLVEANDGAMPGFGEALKGRLDLTRVGWMGHSRGGDAVTVAANMMGAVPYELGAVFALAPTDFMTAVAPDVPWATLLPDCDGDVWTLWGADVFDVSREDRNAPLTQILVRGANHNYYNTVWTNDDASWLRDDSHCGAEHAPGAAGHGRLKPEDQRRQGLAHMAAFFRQHLDGEAGYAPLFDGRAALPLSACPGAIACPDLAHVSHHPGGALTILDSGVAATGRGWSFIGPVEASACEPRECQGDAFVVGKAKRIVWDADANSSARLSVPAGARDFRDHDALVFRMGLDPTAGTATLAAATLVDGAGNEASVRIVDVSSALFLPPGDSDDSWKIVLNDVRLPLAAFSGVALDDVREVRLSFGSPQPPRVHLGETFLVR